MPNPELQNQSTAQYPHAPVFRLPVQMRPNILYARGLIAFSFAAICFFSPSINLDFFSRATATYFFLDGFASLFTSTRRNWRVRKYNWTQLSSIISISAATWLFFSQPTHSSSLAVISGAWAISLGLTTLGGAIEMRRDGAISDRTRTFIGILGAGSSVIGAGLILQTWLDLMNVVGLLGLNALIIGIISISLGIDVTRCIRQGLCAPLHTKPKKEKAA